MLDVLTRAGCFIAIIIAGYVLRKVNFFKEGDFAVLSKITLKITLPAAFISNFSGKLLGDHCFGWNIIPYRWCSKEYHINGIRKKKKGRKI